MKKVQLALLCIGPLALGGCAGTSFESLAFAIGKDPAKAMDTVQGLTNDALEPLIIGLNYYCTAPELTRLPRSMVRTMIRNHPSNPKKNALMVWCETDPTLTVGPAP